MSDDNLQTFSLSDNSPIPKYHQLREILREQTETWQPHQPIPSEAELCRVYDVSRTTVRKALDNLVYEGLLYRVQGKGTYVAPRKLRGRYVQESTGFFEDMDARGISQRTRVLEKGIIEADQFLADRLQLSVGEKVFYMSRLRFVDDEPAHISFSHVPYKLCPGLIDEDFTAQSLYRTMQKYGQVIHHGTRLIEVQFANHEESRLLKTAFEAPLLVVIGTMYDRNDVPIEYGMAKNRADCSQLEIKVVPQDHINL